ncbi:MAG: ABC transporter substrate-binding protein, partial [Ardenticatenaceae bacterium]
SGIVLLLTLLSHLSATLETVLVPDTGGRYVEGMVRPPGNLNPLYLQTSSDQDIAALLFNGLTRTDESGILQPDLATEWEVSENGEHYTFHLRDDILWHDGSPFTAEDVAFTIRVMQDPAYTHDPTASELWRSVVVGVEEPHTIRFTLSDGLIPFAPFLSFTTFGVLPAHLLEAVPVGSLADHAFSLHPVGTGRWRVARVEPTQLVLEPHPAYASAAPILDELVFRFYDDAPAALQGYREGEVMGVVRVRSEDLANVLADPTLNLNATTIAGYTALFLNLERPVFEERALREALMRGLDRPKLIEEVLYGQAVVADGFLMPIHWAYNPQVPHYEHEPEEARNLLEEAGWTDSDGDGIREKDGAPLRFTLMASEG